MSITKNISGTYDIDVSLGYNKFNGKRIRVRRKNIKTLKEAKRIEDVIKTSNNDKFYTFNQLTSSYLIYSKEFDRNSTIVKKERVVKMYISEYFGNVFINEITTKDIKDFKMWLNSMNISTNYKRSIFTMFNSIFNYAIKFEYINKKPFTPVENFKKEKVEMDFWELDEFKKFISIVDNNVYFNFFSLLYFTGMRKGEALALTWKDIKLDKGYIVINKSCSYVAKSGYVINKPKTESSNRKIYIQKHLVNILSEYKVCQTRSSFTFNEDNYVFSINNEIIAKSSITRAFNKYTRLAGVSKIRIHDLRHSHVALLIYLKQDILTVQKRLGHSDASITLNVYGHLYNEVDKILADKLDEVIS